MQCCRQTAPLAGCVPVGIRRHVYLLPQPAHPACLPCAAATSCCSSSSLRQWCPPLNTTTPWRQGHSGEAMWRCTCAQRGAAPRRRRCCGGARGHRATASAASCDGTPCSCTTAVSSLCNCNLGPSRAAPVPGWCWRCRRRLLRQGASSARVPLLLCGLGTASPVSARPAGSRPGTPSQGGGLKGLTLASSAAAPAAGGAPQSVQAPQTTQFASIGARKQRTVAKEGPRGWRGPCLQVKAGGV